VVRTTDGISPSRLRDIHERVFVRAFEVACGSMGKVFPAVCGVGLGELNLLTIQRHLASFSVISSALEDLLDAGEIGACHILSADVGFVRALEHQVAERVEAVSVWPPWRLLEAGRWARCKLSALSGATAQKAEQAARDAMVARLREHGLEGARPRVVVVSESTPIARMFDVVEGALARAGVRPIVRLDFGGGTAQGAGGAAIACRCGVHGALGLGAGPFRAQWNDAQRELSGYTRTGLETSQDVLSLEGLFGHLYLSKFDAQARHLWAADTALELLQPEVVLVGNDRWWGGASVVELARRRGISSVCVQDGVAGDVPSWWWLTADHLAATSEQLVQMLVRHGVAPERCRVTGQPRYDSVTRSGREDQRAVRIALGLDPSRFSVLFAVQTMHGPDYVRSIVAALLAVPAVHVMLRPHPSDPRSMYERLTREHGPERMTLHREGDSLMLLRACDALVTQHSTVILEAALLGRPVITADFGGPRGPAAVVGAAIGTAVCGVDELTREIRRLVRAAHAPTPQPPQAGQAALRALLGPVDGRAGERVGDLVAEALKREPRPVPAAATRSNELPAAGKERETGVDRWVTR
jgi:hypothetical protein